jgi:predicted glycoside hydrolase/deacetylase ChbG (UPF0249 family)
VLKEKQGPQSGPEGGAGINSAAMSLALGPSGATAALYRAGLRRRFKRKSAAMAATISTMARGQISGQISGQIRDQIAGGLRTAFARIPIAKAIGNIAIRTGLRRMRTLSERLGYGPQARLLIVHADDLGLAHSVNSAFISGLATGLINSGSVMVPCPWFSEIAAFYKENPGADIGLHLTLTREGAKDRCAPIASRTQVPSLVDQQGYFLESWGSETDINPAEVEIELRAQIETAYAAGLRPTHLDSHQFRLQSGGKKVLEVYLRLGREYHLPVLISREWLSKIPYLKSSLSGRDIVLDRIVIIRGDATPKDWPDFYRRALKNLPPGVTEFLIHPGHDDAELRNFFGDNSAWGAAWRQRDFDFFTSDEFQAMLAAQNIKLITWREIAKLLERRRNFPNWSGMKNAIKKYRIATV